MKTTDNMTEQFDDAAQAEAFEIGFAAGRKQAEAQRDAALAALRRAQRDLQDLVNDDDIEIDPQFALDRVSAAIAAAQGGAQ